MDCVHCTFSNPANTQICQMCSKSLDIIISNKNLEGFSCDSCTFINAFDAQRCSMCDSLFDVEASSFELDDSDTDDTDENILESHEYSKNDLPEITSPVGNTSHRPPSTEDIKGTKVVFIKELEKFLQSADERINDSPKECEICCGVMGADFFAMFECIHTFCNSCAVTYFTIEITEHTILDCNCPICNFPNLHANEDKHEEYFSLLLASLKPILDENIMNLFEKKLTERALVSDPNFLWCIRCASGFLKDPTIKVTQCPDCLIRFCVDCKKRWESQHTGISCEQFAEWQRDNNPELSKEAIVNYLQKNGIECPKCKFKYDLSRGGCIHFTCTQCKYEFCFGCGKPFLSGSVCKVSSYCKTVGLHSHHSRNCLYFLRDKEIVDLQGLLKANNIQYLVEAAEQVSHNKADENHCPIELQIETKNGIVDTICKESTEKGHAGLCRKHYTEYLIVTITKAKVETLSILTVYNCQELLRFQGISIPAMRANQCNNKYADDCKTLVKNNIMLH